MPRRGALVLLVLFVAVAAVLRAGGGTPPGLRLCRLPVRFLHVPKTGGSSVEIAGAAAGVFWGSWWFAWCAGRAERDCVGRDEPRPHHRPPRDWERPDTCLWRAPTFCVARHPYARALSEYKFRAKRWAGEGDQCEPAAANRRMRGWLVAYRDDRALQHWHLVPAAEFASMADGRRSCDAVLFHEHLAPMFNQHMRSARLPPRLRLSSQRPGDGAALLSAAADPFRTAAPPPGDDAPPLSLWRALFSLAFRAIAGRWPQEPANRLAVCPDLGLADWDADTIAALDAHFEEDFATYGYQRLSVAQLQAAF